MTSATACPHLAERLQLETLYVLDHHLHITDGFVKCASCGATYLVEMADAADSAALFRISTVDPQAAAKTISSLQKGSCDINRGRSEVFSLSNTAGELPELLLMEHGTFTKLVARPDGAEIPKRSWRELPCDGKLIRLCTDRHPC
jgi:hypothetical protein